VALLIPPSVRIFSVPWPSHVTGPIRGIDLNATGIRAGEASGTLGTASRSRLSNVALRRVSQRVEAQGSNRSRRARDRSRERDHETLPSGHLWRPREALAGKRRALPPRLGAPTRAISTTGSPRPSARYPSPS
jgi:hypothetical protein